MARPKKDAPAYRLHRPSGQAIVTLNGRDVYLGPFDSDDSRIAYERELTAWRAHGQGPRRQALTIADMVAAFWRHVERDGLYVKNGRPTSERLCLRVALRPLLRMFGSKQADSFGALDLITVRKALCSPLPPPKEGEKRRRVHTQPIARASVNKHVHRLRGVFRWAVSMELISPTTWHSLKSVESIRRGHAIGTRETGRVPPADLRSVARVLRRVTTPVAAMIRLQWLTGMRPGEVVQMRVGDIQRKGRVWLYTPASHKTEHHGIEREIPLGPKAQRILAPFFRVDANAYLFPGQTRKRNRPHVSEDSYCRAVTRACEKEPPVARWTPGQLRHNAATRFRQSQGLEAARTMLGHTDAATTLIYAEADRRKAMELALAYG